MSPKKRSKVPLSDYLKDDPRGLRVFKILAEPKFSPIDFNFGLLFEKYGWESSDRFRLWYIREEQKTDNELLTQLLNSIPHITFRKLDVDEGRFYLLSVFLDGKMEMFSNDEEYATALFSDLFINAPPSFHSRRDWKIRRKWTKDKVQLAMFLGSLTGSLGWRSDEIPIEISESLDEAMKNIEVKNWKSCVVMCRRATESLMKLAYKRFFGKEPKTAKGKELSLNDIIREFERKKPTILPKHLINILDSIRNLGNVPGAHPKKITKYKFTKSDALFAFSNAQFLVETYFTKIDKDIDTVYTLTIDVDERQ